MYAEQGWEHDRAPCHTARSGAETLDSCYLDASFQQVREPRQTGSYHHVFFGTMVCLCWNVIADVQHSLAQCGLWTRAYCIWEMRKFATASEPEEESTRKRELRLQRLKAEVRHR